MSDGRRKDVPARQADRQSARDPARVLRRTARDFSEVHTILENSRAWLAHRRALSGLLTRAMAQFQTAATDPSGLARVSGPGRAALASRCVWNEGRAAPTRTKCAAFPVPRTQWRVCARDYVRAHSRVYARMTKRYRAE